MRSLLVRSTLVALLLSTLAMLCVILFFAKVMHLTSTPEGFHEWPAAKKEAYLYEHRSPAIEGIELLKFWLREPGQASPYLAYEFLQIFGLSWVAAFLGGIWQARGKRYN